MKLLLPIAASLFLLQAWTARHAACAAVRNEGCSHFRGRGTTSPPAGAIRRVATSLPAQAYLIVSPPVMRDRLSMPSSNSIRRLKEADARERNARRATYSELHGVRLLKDNIDATPMVNSEGTGARLPPSKKCVLVTLRESGP